MKNYLLIISIALTAASCSKQYSAKDFADVAIKSGACVEAETYFHDIVQRSYEVTGSVPKADEVVSEFEDSIDSLSLKETKKDELTKAFKTFYVQLEQQINTATTKDEGLKALGQLEFGTHPDEKLQADYTKSVVNFKALSESLVGTCEKPKQQEQEQQVDEPQVPTDPADETQEPKRPFFEELKEKTANLSHYGALKSFAVAYQSCEAPVQDALTTESEDAEGISVVGRHSSGRGNLREVTDLTKLQRTHPYLKNYRKPASNCVDSKEKPLIYDFGGKPYTTTSENSTMNFFRSHGSGSKELGVDCSGYVFASLMSAGLKLSPSKPLRARNVLSIPARAYKSPGSSMSCIAKVKAGKGFTLKAGDIFASNGHIFIINIVGADPLGVEFALKNNSCSSITYEDFSFTVLQSSPSKGATGMNHMDGADYLATSKTMRQGFEKFARLDCANKQKSRTSTPSIDEASLVRHKMTSDCVAENVLKMDNESCVQSCSY